MATLVKQSGIFFFVATFLSIAFHDGWRGFSAKKTALLHFLAGYILAAIGFFVWAGCYGIVNDAWEITTYKLLAYSGNFRPAQFYGVMQELLTEQSFLWLAALPGLFFLYRSNGSQTRTLGFWFLWAMLGTCGLGFFLCSPFSATSSVALSARQRGLGTVSVASPDPVAAGAVDWLWPHATRVRARPGRRI